MAETEIKKINGRKIADIDTRAELDVVKADVKALKDMNHEHPTKLSDFENDIYGPENKIPNEYLDVKVPTKLSDFENDLEMASSWNDLEDKPFYDTTTNVEIFNDEITCKKFFNYPEYDFDKWLNGIQDKNKKIIVVYDGETYYLSTTYVVYKVVNEDGTNPTTQSSYIVGNVNMYKNEEIYSWEVFYSNVSGEQHRVENFVYEGSAYEHCPFVFDGDKFYTEKSGTHTLQIYDIQGDIKTLDEKVIPREIARYSDIPDIPELTWDNIVNKPFEDTRVIVDFFNGTYESKLQFGAYFIRKTFTSEVDVASLNTVNVIYDGIEYLNLQPNVADMYGISLLYVGNTYLMPENSASMLGLEQVDTGEPFCFLYMVSDVDIYTNDTAPTSHTVVVQAINGELKTLDPKFLPDDIGGAGSFIVNINEGQGTGEPKSLDKTYVEIKEAYDKGQNIICVGNVTGAIYTLQSISSGGVLFAANRMGGWVGSTEMLVYGYMGITTNDEIMYMEDQLVKVEVLQQAFEMVQLKQDNNLTTTSKEIVGAINELKTQFDSLINGNEVEY